MAWGTPRLVSRQLSVNDGSSVSQFRKLNITDKNVKQA